MQVENAIAFARDDAGSGLEIRVNFGVFAGRDATTAELDELGRLLVPEVGEVSIVGEQRHELAEGGAEVVVHQVLVNVPADLVPAAPREREALTTKLVGLTEIWARQCMRDRRGDLADL